MADPARKALLRKWEETQGHWDDHDFLESEANPFMKMRWRRLNRRCAAQVADQAARLGRGVDLLDVGCAHADFRQWCLPWLSSYTGIEPSRALLPRRLQPAEGMTLIPGKAEELPVADNSVDMVLIKEVLDHCYGPAEVAAEAWRVLRPGGRLVITLTNDHAWYKLLFPAWAERVKAGQHDHLYYFEPGTVIHLARDAGFVDVSRDDSHYLRLPGRVESLLGRSGDMLGFAAIGMTAAAGRLLAPGLGGSFWVTAFKPGA